MALMENRLLGKVTTRLGPFVLSYWKGIPYFRYEPWWRDSEEGANAKEVYRKRLTKVIKKLKPVIKAGFDWDLDDKAQFKDAFSYFLNQTTRGSVSRTIDFSALPISKGSLAPAENAKAVITSQKNVSFSWSCNKRRARTKDRALILAYSPDTDEAVWKIRGPLRKDLGYTLELPESFSGQSVETYLAFTSGDKTSDSVHVGSFRV